MVGGNNEYERRLAYESTRLQQQDTMQLSALPQAMADRQAARMITTGNATQQKTRQDGTAVY
jgi:hypothetical protein